MASIAVRHNSKTLIPKSHQSLINFSRFFSSDPPKTSSLDEIRKNLSQFQRKSSETPNPNPQFRNVFNKRNSFTSNPNPNSNKGADVLSFDKIRESLTKLKSDTGFNKGMFANQQLSFNNIKKSIEDSNNVSGNNNVDGKNFIGGFQKKLFEEEVKEEKAKKPSDESRYQLFKTYSYTELGAKLKELRPNTEFSLKELQQRLGNLKENEEKNVSARKGGIQLTSLRESLQKIKSATDGSSKGSNLDILAQASFLQLPPKDHLIEKYFHPDNMSSAEKLKLELIKVRDEFKISESDCGSTRVQIAQLTTEILHLSSVLHKKDKHSLRGLQLKVQKRKKLLKYLRRTDWDSYCFVLSKLGLRDNPDYKN